MWLVVLVVSAIICGVSSTGEGISDTVGYGSGGVQWSGEVLRLSWKPRLYWIPQFLSPEECQHLIDIATPHLKPIGQKGGMSDKYGSSTGTFIDFGYDEVFSRIEERIAQVAMIPPEYQEPMQILKYAEKEEFDLHYDFYYGEVNAQPKHGGQLLQNEYECPCYRSDVEEGGETVFSKAVPKAKGNAWSECARQGLAIRPTETLGAYVQYNEQLTAR